MSERKQDVTLYDLCTLNFLIRLLDDIEYSILAYDSYYICFWTKNEEVICDDIDNIFIQTDPIDTGEFIGPYLSITDRDGQDKSIIANDIIDVYVGERPETSFGGCDIEFL